MSNELLSRRERALALLHSPIRQEQIKSSIATLDQESLPSLILIAGVEVANMAANVGVMSGSFNPPTLAHCALAESARTRSKLDAVVWTISRITIDKEHVTRASLESRLAILDTLVTNRPNEAVAVINRGLYVSQIEAFRRALPQLRTITFIVGFDKIEQILDKRYYTNRTESLNTLFSQARILVAPRESAEEEMLAELFASPENRQWADHVSFLPLDVTLRHISSSHVRERILRDEPIGDIVPPEALALVDAGSFRGD
jgi:nicotinic acid mononucleotide adenylyltransferase